MRKNDDERFESSGAAAIHTKETMTPELTSSRFWPVREAITGVEKSMLQAR